MRVACFVLAVPPPPVNGLGTIGGFKLFVEDRADLGYDELYRNTQGLVGQGYQTPGLSGLFSTFTVNVPQLDAEIDRVKAKSQGVPLQNLFETLQIYLGSLYVNDFNRFGRTFQVVAQADARFRDRAEHIGRLKTRNLRGEMVPLASLVTVREAYGPDRVMRYNGYPAAEINGGPAPGFSSGQAEELMERIVQTGLPKGMSYEWTDLTYQKILAGDSSLYIYPLCLLLVFLVLAAQYESFRLPLAIVLIVPLCLLFAIAGVWISGGDNNIFTQIGLIVLVGLACKNAILIVEFAKSKQDEGMPPVQAALEAARLRLRPILMTSIAFIAGVFPLVISTGAGAEMRRAMGVAVFAGMIGVTFFGLFLTPVFYVVLMRLRAPAPPEPAPAPGPVAGGGDGAGAPAVALLLLGLLALSPVSLQGAVGPDYHRPEVALPEGGFEDASPGSWKQATPSDTQPRGAWWRLFGDEGLDRLEAEAAAGNQDLKAALARVEQARAGTRQARSEYFPSLSADPNYSRTRYSPNGPLPFPVRQAHDIKVPFDLTYELDLWGRVRRGVESAVRDAEARAAALESLQLALHAEVAQNYFALRATDAELASVRGTTVLRQEALKLVHSRVTAGSANELEEAQAEAELAVVQVDLASIERRRSELRNGIALLLGKPATGFALPDAPLPPGQSPPAIPAGLPGDLLERRPDVAEAERDLAARNARIGMAKAAFFPTVRLTGFAGWESTDVESLFNWQSRMWSLGPSITLPIFQGNRNRASLRRAQASWEEGVATYRERVLVAFREVQDALTATRLLTAQSEAQARAVTAAQRAARLSRARYDAGFVSYLEVIEAERLALASERAAAQLAGQRFVTAVQLIKAVGGGWESAPLEPKAKGAARARSSTPSR